METTPSCEDNISAIATTANRIRAVASEYLTWGDYLESKLEETDDLLAYDAFCTGLATMRTDIARLSLQRERGSVKMAYFDTVNILSADSLRSGFMFGMFINDELLAHRGNYQRYGLDQLAPHITAIFHDIQTTYSNPDDIIWTFQLYAENFYHNTLAHPEHPDYHALNNQPDPVKSIVDDICTELYLSPEATDDQPWDEYGEIDARNFRHGFAIARRAHNARILQR